MTDTQDTNNTEEKPIFVNPLIAFIRGRFATAKLARNTKENQWLRNARTLAGQDLHSGDDYEIDKTFLRTTNNKTTVAVSQLNEALLSDKRFPISITASVVPEGISKVAHAVSEAVGIQETQGLGFPGDALDLQGDATRAVNIGSAYSEELDDVEFKEGNDPKGEGPSLMPAREAALRMDMMIQDQLAYSKSKLDLRKAIIDNATYGSGVLKLETENREVIKWDKGVPSFEYSLVPKVSYVDLFSLYLDPNARDSHSIQWAIERHRLHATDLLDSGVIFNPEAIEKLLSTGGNYSDESHESTMKEDSSVSDNSDLYEVLEYWGTMTAQEARETHNLPVNEDNKGVVTINAWISGNELLSIELDPTLPRSIPYFLMNYEADLYSIYGRGVPEQMEGMQYALNKQVRRMSDNAAMSSNVILEVDVQGLAEGSNLDLYPGKVFVRQPGATGSVLNSIRIPNITASVAQEMQISRQQVDEDTMLPSVLSGQTGVTGTGRTASGLQMIMDGASMSIKDTVRGIDEDVLKPLGLALFYWNMQFNHEQHPDIVGDLEVTAQGAFNLQTKEVKLRGMNTFLQLAANQQIAPYVKVSSIVKEIAILMDMDPEEVLNSPEEALVIMALQAQTPQAPQAPQEPAAEVAPQAGTQGFTGNNAGVGNTEGL